MKKYLLVFPLFLCACVSSPANSCRWQSTGPDFGPNKNKIEQFSSEKDIQRYFGYIGLITCSEENATQAAKMAALHGADAVITLPGDKTSHAIKYADNLTPAQEQIVREYNAVTIVRD